MFKKISRLNILLLAVSFAFFYGFSILFWRLGFGFNSALIPGTTCLSVLIASCNPYLAKGKRFYLITCLSREQTYWLEVMPFVVGFVLNGVIVCCVLPLFGGYFNASIAQIKHSFILFFLIEAICSACFYLQYRFSQPTSVWIGLLLCFFLYGPFILMNIPFPTFIFASVFELVVLGIICTAVCVLSFVGAYRLKDKVKY